jgi:hypothetical protein
VNTKSPPIPKPRGGENTRKMNKAYRRRAVAGALVVLVRQRSAQISRLLLLSPSVPLARHGHGFSLESALEFRHGHGLSF